MSKNATAYGQAYQELQDLKRKLAREKDPAKKASLNRQIAAAERRLPSHW